MADNRTGSGPLQTWVILSLSTSNRSGNLAAHPGEQGEHWCSGQGGLEKSGGASLWVLSFCSTADRPGSASTEARHPGHSLPSVLGLDDRPLGGLVSSTQCENHLLWQAGALSWHIGSRPTLGPRLTMPCHSHCRKAGNSPRVTLSGMEPEPQTQTHLSLLGFYCYDETPWHILITVHHEGQAG